MKVFWILSGLMAATMAFALTPEARRGLEIAREADTRDLGFGDFTADMEMILTNRQGKSSTRILRNRTLEQENDGDKLLVLFDNPRDVKGTAFLAFTHRQGPDDQWLYLPSLKRVKRISSGNKSGPFMGSEFAYEDLTSQEVDKYRYRFLGTENLNGIEAFKLERRPVDPKSGYTRQLVWYDQKEYRIYKIEFYDRKDALLKTLTYEGYQQYLGKYWRADRMFMQNHQTGKSTELRWKKYDFRTGLSDRNFDRNALKRAR
ncbi:Outer membrane lipoprotein-sorting protein [Sulfidibacter corallicola]|uniref:Outer membrane lipoprotein-sorting protein n=1 Tax=Sulfidibacter corallicola TaxID=2818388 RepID=A0A8A4TLP1_SULCO|nr:outer membrane lipoprotein-sorting protein [Sulfidibacter corallicola]QTD50470.1 outer membrane lipoprotein-sorting protein [Sulfidibacter corallicola]